MTPSEARRRLRLAALLLRRFDKLLEGKSVELDGEAVRLGALSAELLELSAELVLREVVDNLAGNYVPPGLAEHERAVRADLLEEQDPEPRLRVIEGGER